MLVEALEPVKGLKPVAAKEDPRILAISKRIEGLFGLASMGRIIGLYDPPSPDTYKVQFPLTGTDLAGITPVRRLWPQVAEVPFACIALSAGNNPLYSDSADPFEDHQALGSVWRDAFVAIVMPEQKPPIKRTAVYILASRLIDTYYPDTPLMASSLRFQSTYRVENNHTGGSRNLLDQKRVSPEAILQGLGSAFIRLRKEFAGVQSDRRATILNPGEAALVAAIEQKAQEIELSGNSKHLILGVPNEQGNGLKAINIYFSHRRSDQTAWMDPRVLTGLSLSELLNGKSVTRKTSFSAEKGIVTNPYRYSTKGEIRIGRTKRRFPLMISEVDQDGMEDDLRSIQAAAFVHFLRDRTSPAKDGVSICKAPIILATSIPLLPQVAA